MSALDAPVELWRAWRQDAELDAALGAGLLEVGHEFAAAVALDGADLRM